MRRELVNKREPEGGLGEEDRRRGSKYEDKGKEQVTREEKRRQE